MPVSRLATACVPGVRAQARVGQLIAVTAASASSSVATLTTFERRGTCFVRVGGPWAAEAGRAGFSAHHVEGDGTTPTGTFTIGPVIYGIDADPGVHEHYHRLVCGDWWDEDPASPLYNRFVHVACGTAPSFAPVSEALWTEAPDYDWFALIDYNTDPVVPGRGSAIFLHVSTGAPTQGCVSIPAADLLSVLTWLRPAQQPAVMISAP